MHSPSTRAEFLRLRTAGLSFAHIARQLGVSKPTLIAWSRASRTALDSGRAKAQAQLQAEISTSANQELAELKRRHDALRQELLSRSLREIPTSCLEILAGELRQRIEHLDCSRRGEEADNATEPAEAFPSPLPKGRGPGRGVRSRHSSTHSEEETLAPCSRLPAPACSQRASNPVEPSRTQKI